MLVKISSASQKANTLRQWSAANFTTLVKVATAVARRSPLGEIPQAASQSLADDAVTMTGLSFTTTAGGTILDQLEYALQNMFKSSEINWP
jgi:hypothetical protein